MKKSNLKTLSCILTAAVIVSVINPVEIDAKKVIRLNKARLTLKIGQTSKLKLKNAKKSVKWISKNKKIATVSKGKVKAISIGKTTVIAKSGKKKYICKVSVNRKETTRLQKNNADDTSNGLNQLRLQEPTATSVNSSGETLEPVKTPVNSSGETLKPVKTPESQINSSDQTLIYDSSQEVPSICSYETFKYNSFKIWLCPFNFYGEGVYKGNDYRGKKLHYELTIKNSGERDLPLLDICFNYTSPKVYPTVLRVHDPAIDENYGVPTPPDPEAEYPNEEYASYEEALEAYDMSGRPNSYIKQPIEKGQTYTYTFDYIIPNDAFCGDKDPTYECNYPIMLYISNLKLMDIYQEGDEITILGLKIYEGRI